MPLRGQNSIQLARYWPGTLLTECGPYLFELHLLKAECSIKTGEEPILCGGFMLFLKKKPQEPFSKCLLEQCIIGSSQADLRLFYLCFPPCPLLVSSGGLSCTEGWLKSHILYLDTGYGDSSSFSLCLNLQWGQPSAQSCLCDVSGCSGACTEPPWGNFPGVEA